ncbi:hypothetical protein [Streptomyces sp. NPDC002276]
MQRARRSAGTLTAVDVLLRWTWIRRRSPAQDIEDFKSGQALLVMGMTKTIAGEVTAKVGKGKQIVRLRSGHLSLTAGGEPVWSDRRGDRSATLKPPFSLKPGEKVRLGPKFERYELVTEDGTFDLIVTKVDGKLVRYAFGQAHSGNEVP